MIYIVYVLFCVLNYIFHRIHLITFNKCIDILKICAKKIRFVLYYFVFLEK